MDIQLGVLTKGASTREPKDPYNICFMKLPEMSGVLVRAILGENVDLPMES